jgi:hypothetical protein
MGGSLMDPGYVDKLLAWAATQPGVNPSVKVDAGYWKGRFLSGAFKEDVPYAISRMMTPEGPPEGGAAGAPGPTDGAPSGAVKTPEGTWIVAQLEPPSGQNGGQWKDNKGQLWTLSGGRPTKVVNGPGGGPPPAGGPAGPGVAPPPPGSPLGGAGGGSYTAPQGLWGPDFMAQLRSILMQRMAGATKPVDPNDPNIASTMTAARDEATRSSTTERNQLAERLYAQGGLNTDAITQQIQQSGEHNAQGLSSLRATLITRELESRRSELRDLLQMATQAGDAQMARDIQMQLAALNAQVQRESMGVDLAKYSAYLNTQTALAGLRG